MMFGPALRHVAVFALLATLPVLAGCGDDDGTPPPATPTATRSQGATATATTAQGATATATSPQNPTSTSTVAVTASATSAATSTATQVPTATATPTGTSAATITPTFTQAPEGFRDVANAQAATFVARGSVNQVYVTDAPPNTVLELVGSDSFVAMAGTTDANGALILREVPIGAGYHIVSGHPGPLFASGALEVTAWDDPPDHSFYANQVINPGYGYLETRDGTLLAINVYLPGPPEDGPYPTVIEYSGYDPANPDASQPSTLISRVLGFAAVGVNIRGTGCSGGAFQFFEPLQSTDGYDVVETIAAQPWVQHNHVGMVGISYPGISQLFTAQLQPPHLAAIAPLSVISETGLGTLYPGGILNNGFATDWAADRARDAMPGGQRWSQERMDEGDQVCIDNMKLRGQTPDILQMIADNEFYNAAVADPVTPAKFVHNITVPVFLAGAWQDEQVGGYVATMLDRFTGTDKVHFTLVNGGHTESLIPAIFHRWMEFLWLYVRREVPATPGLGQVIVDEIGRMIFTSTGTLLPPDRFTGMTYETALAAFEAEPPVRVLFESGAGGASPGAPAAAFEHNFDAWPLPELVPTAFYFADDGALVPELPSGDGFDSFVYDPSTSQQTSYSGSGDGIWSALPNWTWQPLRDGKALAYATAPLAADTVMIGSGSVDLWVKASATDVDLQVALTEIRPDGQEIYIQNGWLRASRRTLDESRSSELRPVPTGLLADVQPVPSDEFVLARVELFPFAHAFRAGSRVRLSVTSPGGDRPLWQFDTPPVSGEVTVDIAHSAAFPSRVVLPVVPDLEVPTALPPCPGVRGQPCRTYVELANTPG
jgi:predicted acyl esterase